ncbi:MAG: phospholipase D-like domain-containing protein [Gemmatimonadales bacterium]
MTAHPDPRRDVPPEVVERALDRAAGGRAIPGNAVTLLFDGPDIFPEMLGRIAAARRWIHFDNYIIRTDATGLVFAEALRDAARRGVRVRVLTDWIGSLPIRRRYWRELREGGVDVRFFNPPRLLDITANFSRDHRKLLVTDGERAVVGGFCIGDEWAGGPGRPAWRDTAMIVDGPAASAVDRAFATAWRAAGAPLPGDELAPDVPACGDSLVRVLAGEPGGVRASRTTELILSGAADRVWITDAYLVAPRGIFQSLLDAAREGVDVRLLVPGVSDLPHIRNITRLGYGDLLGAGVRIFEWRGSMLHAKSIVADGRWVRVGSSNLNLSSLLVNWEIDLLVDDREVARMMEDQFRRDLDQSVEVLRTVVPSRRGRLARRLTFSPHEGSRRAVGMRERRRRAVIALRAVLAGSKRTLFLQYSVGLAVTGALFLLFPRTMSGVFAVIVLWLATAAWVDAFRSRRG